MKHFDLKVGFHCCQDCVHCVVNEHRKYGNLSFNQISDVISKIPLDYDITITGGEPTIRPDFLKILRLCQNHNSIALQTNGLGLNEMIVANLKQFRIYVLLTIHSFDKDTYLRVSRGPEDGYDKAVNAAKLLTKYEIPFTWQIVAHKLNLHTVLQTFRFAKLINPNIPLKFTNPHPIGLRNWKNITCSLTEMKPIVNQLCEEFRDDIWFEHIPFCFLGDHTDIMKKSRVHDSKDETLGVRFENKLNFDSYYMNQDRTKSKNCKKCVYYNFDCPGIYRGYKELFGDRELKPIKYLPLPAYTSSTQKNYMYEKYNFWLFTTTKCNAQCSYCQQKENSEMKINKLLSDCIDMTEDKLRYIFEECIKAHERGIAKQFEFNISGGEPFIMFNEFKNVIPEYQNKYPYLFSFNSSTNATLLDEEKLDWFLENLYSCLISLDSLRMSKPINGISSSKKTMEVINKINAKKPDFHLWCICVYENQSIDEMLELAEFAVKNLKYWRVALARPVHHTKEQILEVVKPVIKYLHDNNYSGTFDFEGWDLVNKNNISGCPCGQDFLSIYPNLDVSPTNGENLITLGKFNWNIPELVNHQDNTYYREDMRPDICSQCELKSKCDGGCKSNHKNPEMLKERCDAIKELFEYVKTLK
jgi:radical SAM protein with 4Fe4S-binding SPASM domain